MTDPRVPPCSVEAERSVLGSVLMESDDVLGICDRIGLSAESFYVPAHRLIYQAMLDLRTKARPVDLITVPDLLKAQGHLDECGGDAYCERLVDETPTSSHAAYYAKIVSAKAMLRAVITACREATDSAYESGDADKAESVTGQLLAQLSRLVDDMPGGSSTKLFDVAASGLEQWRQAIHHGFHGVASAWPELNQFLGGWRYGQIGIVAGYQQQGKSLYAGCDLLAAAMRNIPSLFISLEMPAEQVAQRIIGQMAGFSTFKFDQAHGTISEWERAEAAHAQTAALPMHIIDGDLPMDRLVRVIQHHVSRYGVRFVVIDYVQLCYVSGHKENRNHELSAIMRTLALTALSLDIHILVLSQLSRDAVKQGRRPCLADLRDSGSLEQQARQVVLIYEDTEDMSMHSVEDHDTGDEFSSLRYVFEVAKNNAGPPGKAYFYRIGARQKWVAAEMAAR